MEDVKARLLARRQETALATLVRHIEQGYRAIQEAKRLPERKTAAGACLPHLQRFVGKGLDLNLTSEDLYHMPGAPIWFAWLCMVESVFSMSATLTQRA